MFSIALCVAAPALAQRAPRAAQGEYEQVIGDALAEFKRGNWEEASALFQRAHALNPSARTLRGMGLSAYEARRYVDAIRFLAAAQGDQRLPLTPEQRKEAASAVALAEQYVGRIVLHLTPENAGVQMNGEHVEPDADGVLLVDPGPIELEISAPGFVSALRRVRVAAGRREEITVDLSADAAMAQARALPVAEAGQGAPRAAAMPPEPQRSRALTTWKWVAAGAALAAAAGGVAAFVVAGNAADHFNSDACLKGGATRGENCGAYSDRTHAADRWSVIAFSAAGAFAVTSAVLFVLDARARGGHETQVACGIAGVFADCRVRF